METNTNKTQNTEQKNWQEKLSDKITSDNELLGNILKTLTNPVILIILIIAAGWWFGKKRKPVPDDEALVPKLKKIKKKYKKLKRKHYADMGENRMYKQRKAVLD